MASGVEMMASTLLKAFGVNPDEIKREAVQRIEQFETNVSILNSTQTAILANLKNICAHLGVEYVEPVAVETPKQIAAE